MEELLFTVKAKFHGMGATVFLRVMATDWGEARSKAETLMKDEFSPDALDQVASWEVLPGDSLESLAALFQDEGPQEALGQP